jgi:hypothetical protein
MTSQNDSPRGLPQTEGEGRNEALLDSAMAERIAGKVVDHAYQVLAEKRQALIAALDAQIRQLQTHNEVLSDEVKRLSGCLAAMARSDLNATAKAYKSVAYDTVFNLITPDVAEFQLDCRSTLEREEEEFDR